MTRRIPLMAGNWKMNLDHTQAIALVQKLAWALADAKHDDGLVEVAVIPPFTSLRSVQTILDADKIPIGLGAQDVSASESGAYTGEVSAQMLSRLGCRYVVVGHSERRQYHDESDALIGSKAAKAFEHGIVPIICVGEMLEIRKQGRHVAHTLAQVDGCFEGLTADDAARSVIAYEPVWAIGTGEVATPRDAQEVCSAIRGRIAELYSVDEAQAIRILYGGSVKSSNIAAIMAEADVDGALVGGASLSAEEFSRIVRFLDHAVGL